MNGKRRRVLTGTALAGAVILATGTLSAPQASADSFIQGTIEAGPTLTVRSGPGTGYAALGTVGYRAIVYIDCYNTGTWVTATWPDGSTWTTDVWDGLWDGSTGTFGGAYVADAWVNTGGDTSTMVRHC